MPLAFLIIGFAVAITAFRDTYGQLGKLVANDFTGSNSFLIWIGAFIAIGLIGFIPGLEKPSRLMIALVLVVMFLKNGGVFQKFKDAVSNPQSTPAQATAPTVSGPAPVQLQISGGGSGGISGLGNILSGAGSSGNPSATDAIAGTGGLY